MDMDAWMQILLVFTVDHFPIYGNRIRRPISSVSFDSLIQIQIYLRHDRLTDSDSHFTFIFFLSVAFQLTTMVLTSPLRLTQWLSENAEKLRPPVNNFCLYAGKDFIVMAVGGPNERNDYHVNETEEWFYQHKGGMLLRVVDGEDFKDIRIEEGEMFLLPGASC